MSGLFRCFVSDGSAITAIEYGLIAALIAMVVIAAVGILGTDLRGVFSSVASSL
jgi:pilus assembly protein Flp/PilA